MLIRFYRENVRKCRDGGGEEAGGGEIRGRRTHLTTKANAEIQYRRDREFIAKVKSDRGIEFS